MCGKNNVSDPVQNGGVVNNNGGWKNVICASFIIFKEVDFG